MGTEEVAELHDKGWTRSQRKEVEMETEAGGHEGVTARGLIDWRRLPLLAWLDLLLNRVIGARGPLGLNRIIDWLTNATGVVILPMSSFPPLSLNLLPGLRLNVSLTQLTLTNLDSLDMIEMLKPSKHDFARLDSSVTMRRLGVEAAVEFRIVRTTSLVADREMGSGSAKASNAKGTAPATAWFEGCERDASNDANHLCAEGGSTLERDLPPEGVAALGILAKSGGTRMPMDENFYPFRDRSDWLHASRLPPWRLKLRSSLRDVRLATAARVVFNLSSAADIALSQLLPSHMVSPDFMNMSACFAEAVLGVTLVDLRLTATVDEVVAIDADHVEVGGLSNGFPDRAGVQRATTPRGGPNATGGMGAGAHMADSNATGGWWRAGATEAARADNKLEGRVLTGAILRVPERIALPFNISLPSEASAALLDHFNAHLSAAIESLRQHRCPPIRTPRTKELVDFSSSLVVRATRQLLDHIGAVAPAWLRRFGLSNLSLPGELFRSGLTRPIPLTVSMEDVTISNLDAVYDVDMLRPQGGMPSHTLSNAISLGGGATQLIVEGTLRLEGVPTRVRVAMAHLPLVATMLLEYNWGAIAALRLHELGHGAAICKLLVEPLQKARLEPNATGFIFSGENAHLQPVTSWAGLVAQRATRRMMHAVNEVGGILALAIRSLTPGAQPRWLRAEWAAQLVTLVTPDLVSLANREIARIIGEAHERCATYGWMVAPPAIRAGLPSAMAELVSSSLFEARYLRQSERAVRAARLRSAASSLGRVGEPDGSADSAFVFHVGLYSGLALFVLAGALAWWGHLHSSFDTSASNPQHTAGSGPQCTTVAAADVSSDGDSALSRHCTASIPRAAAVTFDVISAADALDTPASPVSATAGDGFTCLAEESCRLAPLTRLAVPALLLATLALMVGARGVPGVSSAYVASATVTAELRLAGERVQLPPLQNIILYATLHEYWEARTYSLAILIGALAIGLYFVKLFTLLASWWIVPRSSLQLRMRGLALLLLDLVGKWLAFDYFLVLVSTAAFDTPIALPAVVEGSTLDSPRDPGHVGNITGVSDTDFVFLRLQVGTLPAFYLMLVAVGLLQCIGHVVRDVHEWAELAGDRRLGLQTDPCRGISGASPGLECRAEAQAVATRAPEAIRSIVAFPASAGATTPLLNVPEGDPAWQSPPERAQSTSDDHFCALSSNCAVVPLMLGVAAVLLLVSAFLPLMKVRYTGLLGDLRASQNTILSLTSIGAAAGDADSLAATLTRGASQILYFLVVLVAPIVWMACIAYLWVTRPRASCRAGRGPHAGAPNVRFVVREDVAVSPFTALPEIQPGKHREFRSLSSTRTRRRMLRVCELLYAWSMHDVVAIVVFNYSFEMGPYVQYLLGAKCASLNQLLETGFRDLVSEPLCLAINASLAQGMPVLAIAVLLSTVAGLYAQMTMQPP